MADSALSSDPLERYGAIERAYCEERWMAVIHDGQTLLGDLAHAEAPSPEGLKERLQLLIGHAFLYGLGDRDSAEDLYQAVLRSGAEPSLRQIAEQGLQQCALPIAPAESEPLEPEDRPSGSDPAASATTSLWQEAAPDVSPAEAAMAPPASASANAQLEPSTPLQTPQDSWGTPAQPASSDPSETPSWLTAPAATAAQDSSAPPVMPWLQGDAAAAAGPAVPLQSEQIGGGLDQAGSAPPSQAFESWGATFAAPTQPEAALSPETAAALQATTAGVAAFEQLRGGPRSDSDPGGPEPLDAQGPSAAPRQTGPDNLNSIAALPVSPIQSAGEPWIQVDVVDEPELIELHESSSPHDEVVLLPADPDQAAMLSLTKPDQGMAAEQPDPLDRRGGEPMAADRWQEPLEAPQQPEPQQPAPAESAQAESAAPAEIEVSTLTSPMAPVGAGSGPFSAPPEPVAEEDPELLMGLLKVEMG